MENKTKCEINCFNDTNEIVWEISKIDSNFKFKDYFEIFAMNYSDCVKTCIRNISESKNEF
jgi:hypothetical protein